MQVQDCMSTQPVTVAPEESIAVAARLLRRYNIGALPVCGAGMQVRGVITDRDIVTRCVAADADPARTTVRQVMSRHVVSVPPEMDAQAAASLMGREQIRRLPVCREGKLVGMLSLGDMARRHSLEASEALCEICQTVQNR